MTEPLADGSASADGEHTTDTDDTRREPSARTRQLELLASVARVLILGDQSELDLLDAVFGEVAQSLGAEMYFNYQPFDDTSMRLSTWGGLTDDERTLFETMRYGELLCGRVAVRRQAIVVEDIAHTDAEGSEAVRAAGYGAYAGFPLVVGDRLLGTVAFITRTRTHFADGEIDTVQAVCDQVAAMLDRRHLTRELRASDERFRAAFDQQYQFMALLAPDGTVLEINGTALAATGAARDDVVGRPFSAAPWWPDADEARQSCARRVREAAQASNPIRSIDRFRGADGDDHLADTCITAVRDDAGRVRFLIAQGADITEWVGTERELRRSEQRYRTLVDATSITTWSTPPDGFHVEGISTWQALTGQSDEEMAGEGWRSAVHPDDIAGAAERWRHAIATGTPFSAELRVRRHDGTWRWMSGYAAPVRNAKGDIVEWFGMNLDVTARKRADEDLREREEQLRLAMEAADAGSWSLAIDTGEFVASDRAMEIHALPVGTPMTHEVAMANVHPDDRADTEAAVRHSIETGEPFRHEHRLLLPDGTVRWVGSLAECRTIQDRPTLVGFVQDITVRKQAEATLLAQQAEQREIAVALQTALLPAELPRHPYVQVAARYVAGSHAMVVGGDWYDAVAFEDGRIAFTVGDVVGSGLEAAVAMGQLRTALAAGADTLAPAALLDHLEAFVARSAVTDFATACVAVYDPRTGMLEYASAGHPPILVISPDGTVRRLQDAQSLPILGERSRPRSGSQVSLEPGSLLVFYSDGLVERRRESILVGLDRLETAATSVLESPVDDVCEAVLHALDADAELTDDVVVVVARVTLADDDALRLVVPAAPPQLSLVRHAVRSWLTARPGSAVLDDVLVSVSEACSNVVEHAYPDGASGTVELTMERVADGSLNVCVRDRGRYRQPPPPHPGRGRGTMIIQRLTEDFERTTTDAGTAVRFRLPARA